MKKYWQSFGFTRSELNGLVVLLGGICIAAFIYSFLPAKVSQIVPVAFSKQQLNNSNQITLFKDTLSKANQLLDRKQAQEPKDSLFFFDPNTASAQIFQKLGLSARQANTIVNYRNKGGKFYKKEDFQKIYSLKPADYNLLAPFIRIASKKNKITIPSYQPPKYQRKSIPIIEINSADSTMLLELPGIGMAYARWIIQYRERLGGFFVKQQLLEVYRMDSLRYAGIESYIKVNQALIKKININTVAFDQLQGHPYLSFRQINALLSYRKQHGNFENPADLEKVQALPASIIQKIMPYITTQ